MDNAQLPNDMAAEKAVISACLIDPDGIVRASEAGLLPGHFFRESYGRVFSAMAELMHRHEHVDMITVTDALKSKEQENLLPAELTDILGNFGSSVHVAHYSELLIRLSERRNIIRAAGSIAAAAYSAEPGPNDELRDQVSQTLADAMGRPTDVTHWTGTTEEMQAYLDWQEQRATFLEEHPDGLVQFGLKGVDKLLDHLPAETLTIIAARSGIGKTIAMEGCAEYNAQRGHKVVFYHYEISTRDMLHRRVTRHTGVPIAALMRGQGARKWKPQFNEIFPAIKDWQENEIFVHCPGWTAERVAADITRLHNLGQCDLAVIDYLQMIPLSKGGYGANMAQAYGQLCNTLKNTGTHLGIPIILGSQVRRGAQGQGRPTDEDIRNSGEVKERANQVIVLHRPNERAEDPKMGTIEAIEIYVDKSTFGAPGMARIDHFMGWFLYCDSPPTTGKYVQPGVDRGDDFKF